jgi:hypothetical protein
VFSSPSSRVSSVTPSPTLSTPSARPSRRSTLSTRSSGKAAPSTASVAKCSRRHDDLDEYFGALSLSHTRNNFFTPSDYGWAAMSFMGKWVFYYFGALGLSGVQCTIGAVNNNWVFYTGWTYQSIIRCGPLLAAERVLDQNLECASRLVTCDASSVLFAGPVSTRDVVKARGGAGHYRADCPFVRRVAPAEA